MCACRECKNKDEPTEPETEADTPSTEPVTTGEADDDESAETAVDAGGHAQMEGQPELREVRGTQIDI